MTKAQDRFRFPADGKDSREFNTWYDNEDVQRIVWSLYDNLPEKSQDKFSQPFVFYDGFICFETLMNACKEHLLQENKRYFPFIIKPELGSAHYMAGIFRVKNNQIKLFLFNPIGYANKKHAQKRLGLTNPSVVADIDLILSPHPVQNAVYDGGVLVSCGPLCIEFLEYALNNPSWIQELDERFILPEFFLNYQTENKDQYRQKIHELRIKHDAILGNLADSRLDLILAFYERLTDKFLKYIDQDDSDDAFYELYDDDNRSEFSFSYTFPDLNQDYIPSLSAQTGFTGAICNHRPLSSIVPPSFQSTAIENRDELISDQNIKCESDRALVLNDEVRISLQSSNQDIILDNSNLNINMQHNNEFSSHWLIDVMCSPEIQTTGLFLLCLGIAVLCISGFGAAVFGLEGASNLAIAGGVVGGIGLVLSAAPYACSFFNEGGAGGERASESIDDECVLINTSLIPI